MEKVLPITWYFESPIDFEHKQYTLLAYLDIVDCSFMKKILSPHFLHMERMINEMESFNKRLDEMEKELDKKKYIYFENDIFIDKSNPLIYEIKEIIKYSIPKVENKLSLGKIILKDNKQVLY